MRFEWFKKIWASALLAITPAIAYAQPAQDLTQAWFYASSETDRTIQHGALESASKTDNTAMFGLGAVQFFSAIEGFSQDMLKFGLASHDNELRALLPLPLPHNATPEALTYGGLRQALIDFETELENARATLASVDTNEPVAISINFANARFNITGQESIPNEQSFVGLIAGAQSMTTGTNAVPADQEFKFRFDNADAIWLEGYANVILGQVDFLLAHDFSRTFDASFHLFFPKSNLPLQEDLIPNGYEGRGGMFGHDGMIADAITFIHLLDWPVVEAERRTDFARHMTEIARLSRANWAAITVETDNANEWLPGPQQPGIHPLTGIEVTQEMVDGWMQSMDLLEAVMAGKRLVPHWRFEGRGLNLKSYFESTQNFDPVLLLTGPGALPYLEKGNIITQQEWRAIQNLVGRRNFGMVAAWFN
ncbi:MAG: hypothetical protein AAGF25_13865 [Pseudomonadota bacterium]